MHAATTQPLAPAASTGKSQGIAFAVARFAAAAVMLAGAIPKFIYAPDGAQQLAEALGVGRLQITGIGVTELAAAVLLLGLHRGLGGALAVGLMGGALVSHVTKLGFSGSAPAEMWPLALVGLAAGAATLIRHRRSLPIVGSRL